MKRQKISRIILPKKMQSYFHKKQEQDDKTGITVSHERSSPNHMMLLIAIHD